VIAVTDGVHGPADDADGRLPSIDPPAKTYGDPLRAALAGVLGETPDEHSLADLIEMATVRLGPVT
jgi:hypothetical protein